MYGVSNVSVSQPKDAPPKFVCDKNHKDPEVKI